MSVLSGQVNFASLSLKDLLEAREAYHWQLMNKANVVGTAIGRYLIRKADSWPGHPGPATHGSGVRTFENSEVRPYSWPCILVLVRDWVDATQFGGGIDPDHFIPRTLYLADGRAAPVCVVQVVPGVPLDGAPSPSRWPETYVGGGCPLHAEVQGRERHASVGCMVTDGHRTYAMTNRHVAGEPGTVLSANLRGNFVPVGKSADKQLTRLPFSEAFPGFPGSRAYLTLDVGLVDVDAVDDWTSQPFGLEGRVGAVADLNEANLGLQLIDQTVVAFGAASGKLEGVIKALFYRHKAMAGYDYVSEFLIAPADGVAQTRPGDSGTVWYLTDPTEKTPANRVLWPLAMEWGGQAIENTTGRMNFSLATGLSTACELLDVDLIHEGNTGAMPFWGQTGHYSIATVAIAKVVNAGLKNFMEVNLPQISFRPEQLNADDIRQALANGDFVELADVPDLVWKKVAAKIPGGRDYATNAGPEHPNHFADIDAPDKGGGPNLLDLTLQNIDNMSVPVWRQWYAANGQTDARHQGLLPFRVWQLFKVMVEALSRPVPDTARFLCAAGIVSHYLGDACQPLHGSSHSNGYKDQGTLGAKKWPGMGVHAAYEDKMIDRFSAQLLPTIGPAADAFALPIHAIADGRDAAFATVELMGYASSTIPPTELCDTYIQLGGGSSKPVIQGLWDAFGPRTAEVMGAGARYLAALWDAAYAAARTPPLEAEPIDQASLAAIYQDPTFAPSLTLDKVSAEL